MADIRVTGRMVNFTRLTFDTNDHDAIRQQLNTLLDENAYQGATVILDSTVEQELIALIQLLVSLDLQPMAVIDGIWVIRPVPFSSRYSPLTVRYNASSLPKNR